MINDDEALKYVHELAVFCNHKYCDECPFKGYKIGNCVECRLNSLYPFEWGCNSEE